MDLRQSKAALEEAKRREQAAEVLNSYYRDFNKTFGTPHGKNVLKILKAKFYDNPMLGSNHFVTTVHGAQHDVIGFILEQLEKAKGAGDVNLVV